MASHASNTARATKAGLILIMVAAGFLTCGFFGGSFDISVGRALSLLLAYCLIAPVLVLSSPAL